MESIWVLHGSSSLYRHEAIDGLAAAQLGMKAFHTGWYRAAPGIGLQYV